MDLVRFRDGLRRWVEPSRPLARDPVDGAALAALRERLAATDPGLWAAVSVAFHGGLRPGEVARCDTDRVHRAALREALAVSWTDAMRRRYERDGTIPNVDLLLRDVAEHEWGLTVTVRALKQGRAATRTALVPATGTPTCPLAAWREATRRRGSADPLEPAFTHPSGAPVRYRELWKALREVGADLGRALKPHSLRIGSTTALANALVDPTWVQQHGGWNSASGPMPYRRWAPPAIAAAATALRSSTQTTAPRSDGRNT